MAEEARFFLFFFFFFNQLLPATVFQADVLDKRIMPSSQHDDKGHIAGSVAAKAPLKSLPVQHEKHPV